MRHPDKEHHTMTAHQNHTDCTCQTPLTRKDLTQMYAAGRYEEINKAYAAGRFNLDTDK